jgi:hypothetical protein
MKYYSMLAQMINHLRKQDRHYKYINKIEARLRNHFCHGKAINRYYIFWVCVCSFVTQHALRMPCFILSSMACLLLPYFFHKRHDVHNKFREQKIRVLISLQILSHSKKNLSRYYINVRWSSCKVPVILLRLKSNLDFLDRISKKYSNFKFIQVRIVVTELIHMDGKTNRHDEVNSRFKQFCEHAYKIT